MNEWKEKKKFVEFCVHEFRIFDKYENTKILDEGLMFVRFTVYLIFAKQLILIWQHSLKRKKLFL